MNNMNIEVVVDNNGAEQCPQDENVVNTEDTNGAEECPQVSDSPRVPGCPPAAGPGPHPAIGALGPPVSMASPPGDPIGPVSTLPSAFAFVHTSAVESSPPLLDSARGGLDLKGLAPDFSLSCVQCPGKEENSCQQVSDTPPLLKENCKKNAPHKGPEPIPCGDSSADVLDNKDTFGAALLDENERSCAAGIAKASGPVGGLSANSPRLGYEQHCP